MGTAELVVTEDVMVVAVKRPCQLPVSANAAVAFVASSEGRSARQKLREERPSGPSIEFVVHFQYRSLRELEIAYLVIMRLYAYVL